MARNRDDTLSIDVFEDEPGFENVHVTTPMNYAKAMIVHFDRTMKIASTQPLDDDHELSLAYTYQRSINTYRAGLRAYLTQDFLDKENILKEQYSERIRIAVHYKKKAGGKHELSELLNDYNTKIFMHLNVVCTKVGFFPKKSGDIIDEEYEEDSVPTDNNTDKKPA